MELRVGLLSPKHEEEESKTAPGYPTCDSRVVSLGCRPPECVRQARHENAKPAGVVSFSELSRTQRLGSEEESSHTD